MELLDAAAAGVQTTLGGAPGNDYTPNLHFCRTPGRLKVISLL